MRRSEHVYVAGEASPQTPGKKEAKGKKRKAEEERGKRQSEYQRRQEELARRMEESGEQPIRGLQWSSGQSVPRFERLDH